MASIKLYLDIRTPRKDGTFPLKLVVSHKNTFMINLKIYLIPEQFESGKVIDHPRSKVFNKAISSRLVFAQNNLLNISPLKLKTMSDKELKKLIEYGDVDIDTLENKGYSIKAHFEKFIVRKAI